MNLCTEKQVYEVNEISRKLLKNSEYYNRFEKILLKNPDFEYFKNFQTMKSKEDGKFFSFVPLTSVEVERSFSKYRDILSDKKSLSIETIEKYLFLYFNVA